MRREKLNHEQEADGKKFKVAEKFGLAGCHVTAKYTVKSYHIPRG